MASKCLKCSYKMSFYQELLTILTKIIFDPGVGALAGPMNVLKINCPKCGTVGSWEDC